MKPKPSKKASKFKVKLPKKLPKRLPKLPSRLRRNEPEARLSEAIQNLPRITNETVAEHREEVLSSARKYIYPLSHSRHRVVKITVSLLVVAVIIFFAYCGLALYKFQSTSAFIYGVTRVIPFPIAKAGSSYVSYESYLFELRHSMHYYETQQQVNFKDPTQKTLLEHLRSQSLQTVIDTAYVKQLATQHHVSVSSKEVDTEVSLVRSQNRLGSSNQVFQDVLQQFWGWSVDDFKRELQQQLLAQKVVSTLDTGTWSRANSALAQLKSGADFGTLASQVSDDTATKGNGGEYNYLVGKSDPNVAPQVADALFKLQPGEYTGVINTGSNLEIDKLLDINGDKRRAAHIVFTFKDISTYLQPLEQKEKPHTYVTVK